MDPEITWSLEPGPVILALALLALYVPRWVRVRRTGDRQHAPIRQLVCWLLGVLTLVAAQGNPIDKLGDDLLVMHMVQHLLLLDVMPLFLLFGLNRVLMRPATRRIQYLEQRIGFLAQPWFGAIAYIGGMWLWHVPALYDLAARHDTVHLLEHMTFTGIGILYWWHLLRPIPARHAMRNLGPVAYMALTKVAVGLLGAGLTFAPEAIYGFYDTGAQWWGMSAVTDQAAAGALMATEQMVVMGVAFGLIFVRALQEAEQRAVREERLLDRAEREAELAELGLAPQDAAAATADADPATDDVAADGRHGRRATPAVGPALRAGAVADDDLDEDDLADGADRRVDAPVRSA